METIARTWLVSKETAAEIHQLAVQLQVNDSNLVDLLLGVALKDVADQRLRLRLRPMKWMVEIEE